MKSRFPSYSGGEEKMNMITHIVGGAAAIVVLVVCVIKSSFSGNPWAIVTGALYGGIMVTLFSVSSVYHGLRIGKGKWVMRIIDHCTIYFLIAATYTPILLVAIRPLFPVVAWCIFAVEWGLAAVAVVLTAIDLNKYSKLSMAMYIFMGWCILFVLETAVESMSRPGFLWLLGGGICYSVGAVLYGVGKKRKYFHSVFHIFVNIGCLMQAYSIIRYVM